jgi:hypothetical protein
MEDITSDKYWVEEFDVTKADLDRILERMRKEQTCYDLTTLSKRLVLGRLRYGVELSPSVLTSWTGRTSVQLWDPASSWKPGDGVIVALRVGFDEHNHFIYEAKAGEIISLDLDFADMRLDGIPSIKAFRFAKPGSDDAIKWHAKVSEVVAQNQASPEIEDQAEALLLKFPHITDRLLQVMESDQRFVGVEGRWCLKAILPALSEDQIQNLYRQLLIQNKSFSSIELSKLLYPENNLAEFGPFVIQITLATYPKLFINVGSSTQTLWHAVIPSWEQAKLDKYAYDPVTYEILVQPDQSLNKSLAERLKQLGLYNVVVTVAE